jgi:hypothetical protein
MNVFSIRKAISIRQKSGFGQNHIVMVVSLVILNQSG